MKHMLNGAVAAAGVGLVLFKRGRGPYSERNTLVRAIVAACEEAGIDPADVDGFVSYGDDHNYPIRLMSDLGTKELHLSTAVWGGGGGGSLGAFELAAMAIATGVAQNVVVFRALVEGSSGRLSSAVMTHHLDHHQAAAGLLTPANVCAMRAQRMIEERGLSAAPVEALVRADYYHASRNPDAVAFGQSFEIEDYRNSRKIAGPLRLFDCSRESDGAGAVLLVSAERAKDLKKPPVYMLGVAHGSHKGWGDLIENDEDYTSTGYESVARRLWEMTGLVPDDVDVVELYDNFTYQAISALVGHGMTSWESVAEDVTFENLSAPSGRMPTNTDGGSLAYGFLHGITTAIEGVRQLRGESANPVPNARTCLVTGGPGARTNSSAIFANELP